MGNISSTEDEDALTRKIMSKIRRIEKSQRKYETSQEREDFDSERDTDTTTYVQVKDYNTVEYDSEASARKDETSPDRGEESDLASDIDNTIDVRAKYGYIDEFDAEVSARKYETSPGREEADSAIDTDTTDDASEDEEPYIEEYDADVSSNDSDKGEISFEAISNGKRKTEDQLENGINTDDTPLKAIKAKYKFISNSTEKKTEQTVTVNEYSNKPIKSESRTLSACLNVLLQNSYILNRSEEDLPKGCLNYSQGLKQSQRASNSFNLTKDSSSDISQAQHTPLSFREKFRVASDSDSILSIDYSNLSCCSEESDYSQVKIRYDTSSSSSLSSTPYLQSTSSFLRQHISDSSFLSSAESLPSSRELDETESPFGARISSADHESSSNISTENVSPCTTSPLIKEFQHDIDYLAKSEFRTSTPDPKEKNSPKKISNSFSDSFTLPSNHKFVHGVSPLCGARSSPAAHAQSRTRVRVRRSLFYGSPNKRIAILPKPEGFNSSNEAIKQLNYARLSFDSPDEKDFPKKVFKKVPVLPKIMFQDETEEAVYYLITKYLDSDSNCKW